MHEAPSGGACSVSARLDVSITTGNQVCASCSRACPHWAVSALGVLLCARCAYIHSTHTTLTGDASVIRHGIWDAWTLDEVQSMEAKGNREANAVCEATLPPHRKAERADSIEVVQRFIRDKYGQRVWVAEQVRRSWSGRRL